MGIYVEESKYNVNSSIANNTNLYLKTGYCEEPCRSISLSCYSNMTDTVIAMNYPRLSTRYYDSRSGTYKFREVDPWQKLNQSSDSGLYMSVHRNNIYEIAMGTYFCEERSNTSLLEPSQKLAFGVYRNIHCKVNVRYGIEICMNSAQITMRYRLSFTKKDYKIFMYYSIFF